MIKKFRFVYVYSFGTKSNSLNDSYYEQLNEFQNLGLFCALGKFFVTRKKHHKLDCPGRTGASFHYRHVE